MKITLLLCCLFAGTLAFAQQGNARPSPFAKADSLYNLGQWSAARSVYESLLQVEQNKTNAQAWYRLGVSAARLGDAGSALKNVQQAVNAGFRNFIELDTAGAFTSIRNTADFRAAVSKAEINAFPCKGDAKKREFDFWVGEWDVYVTGTNVKAGHSLVQKASGDCMILENWTALGPVPHNGKSMNYVNTQTNKWEQLWIGSAGGPGYVTRFYDGEYKDSAMQFVFEAPTPQGKQAGRFRFFNQGPNQVRQLSETSADGGKTWTTNYDLTYKRKK